MPVLWETVLVQELIHANIAQEHGGSCLQVLVNEHVKVMTYGNERIIEKNSHGLSNEPLPGARMQAARFDNCGHFRDVEGQDVLFIDKYLPFHSRILSACPSVVCHQPLATTCYRNGSPATYHQLTIQATPCSS